MSSSERLAPRHGDEGLSLVEVLVALLVFAILVSGIVAGMTTIARMTADDRARVVAGNLASREIDRMRALADPVKVLQVTADTDASGTPYVVDGRTFTVRRVATMVNQTGLDVTCAGGDTLRYLRVNVRVTWAGMLAGTAPVQDDTLLAPAYRQTDANTGAISVFIKDAKGVAQAGVTVRITANAASATGMTPPSQPANTDATGCAYLGNIVPGTYDVTISKPGWIDANQNTSSVQTVKVTAGQTTTPQFPPFTQGVQFRTIYQSKPRNYGGALTFPTSFDTTFITGGSISTVSTPTRGVNDPMLRYPSAAGYSTVAGDVQSADGQTLCASADPAAWSAGVAGGVTLKDGYRTTWAAPAGGSSFAYIGMGIVSVTVPAGSTVVATPATPAAGTPSCGLTRTYTADYTSTGAQQLIALPYGTWTLSSRASNGTTAPISPANIVIRSNDAVWPVGQDGTIVLDPRERK